MSEQSNSPAATKELDVDDIVDLLDDEKEKTEDDKPLELTPEKKEKKEAKEDEEEEKDEDKEEDEEDELKAIEEELEEPDEEKLELITPSRRKDILKDFPDLFKKHPYLEKAYYRDQKFTELFPTPNDAKIAVDKAETLDNFEQAIMGGSLEAVLAAAKDESQDAFYKLVDNYLPNLLQVDQQAYYHVIGNVVKDTIVTMAREAKSLGEDEGAALLSAANILNQFVFGTSKFEHPKLIGKPDKTEDPREKELEEREQAIIVEQYETVKGTLQTKVDNRIKATIDANIDPKDSMTPYVKKQAAREAFEMLEDIMSRNTRFRAVLDKLWERAYKEKFSEPSADRIKAAYLSTVKTVLPSVIKKARNEALKGIGKRAAEEDREEVSTSTFGRKSPIKEKPIGTGKIRSAKDIPKDKSTLDILNMD